MSAKRIFNKPIKTTNYNISLFCSWLFHKRTEASFCRLSKEIQEIASSTYFGKSLSQLHKQHFESVMPISVSAMFKQIAPGKGL